MNQVAAAIREALQALPSLAVTSAGKGPAVDEVFFPEGHAEVLDPEVSLVVGNRGMGKTFWSLVLADPQLRPEIEQRYLGVRHLGLDNIDVQLGFADAEGVLGSVSRHEIESVPQKVPAEIIWRSVIVRHLAMMTKTAVPKKFKDLVSWVRENPDEQLSIFRAAESCLSAEGKRILFIFDQLDQLATNWERIQKLTQGLMKMALAMKSYKSIKIKVFMRPDQAENKYIFQFPDASKILGASRVLNWKATDLFGLLFFEIARIDGRSAEAFAEICQGEGVDTRKMHPRLRIPDALVGSAENQGAIFDRIAGPLMGSGSKRGRPYTWITAHLADARGEISPRTFLKVIKTAAEWDNPPPDGTAINFHGIQEGVRSASATRLAELEEDYPWVSMALEPLRGLLVPCEKKEIAERWTSAKTVSKITSSYLGASAPIDIVLAGVLGDEADILIKLLREIGVMEERSNRKINVPDIFRVKAGILRKGGVTPQQRRRLQG